MKQMTRVFLRFADALAMIGVTGAALFLAAIPVLVVSEISLRALFNNSIGVSWEYSTYFMALAFLLGAAYTLRTGGHIRVSVLPIKSHPLALSIIEFIASTIGSALCIFLAISLSELAWQAHVRGITSATPEQTPLFLPMTGVAIGAWILVIQMIARVLAVITGELVEKKAPDADDADFVVPTQ